MARAAVRMCVANIILTCQYSRVEAMVIQAHFFVGYNLCVCFGFFRRIH